MQPFDLNFCGTTCRCYSYLMALLSCFTRPGAESDEVYFRSGLDGPGRYSSLLLHTDLQILQLHDGSAVGLDTLS